MGQRVLYDVQSVQTLLRADQHDLRGRTGLTDSLMLTCFERECQLNAKHIMFLLMVFVPVPYLVGERQSAVDVQAVITLQLQQRIAQKFLLRDEAERERER